MLDDTLRSRLKHNQSWWDRLARRSERSPSVGLTRNDGTVRLYAFTCGWLSAEMKMMLARAHGHIRFPIPCYLIDHPKGRVLFDTGLHPDCQHDPFGRLGTLANIFHVHYRRGEEIAARLAQLGIEPESIDYIINSHLHFDHTGGNFLVPNARIVIQRREWEAGRLPEMMKANSYNPRDYDLGHLVVQVDGSHDLFGDGTVVTIPTYGHTPGHQSLKIKLGSGEIVLAADACYLRKTLEELHLPKLVYDRSQMLESLLLLRRLQAAGARIFYGHDPDFWRQVPQAPLLIR
jgi:glyoxylase-like metal-dependent hydrolase (beta-lactamase superfamily II)